MKLLPISLFALAVLFCSCATTSVEQTWKSPEYHGGPVTSVAVLAIAQQGLLRQGFENRFVAQFGKAGVKAITTFDLLSLPEIKEDKMAAATRFRAAGAEAIVILRLMSTAASYREVRPGGERYAGVVTGFASTPWYNYYDVAFMDMSPTYGNLKEYVYLEASVFDLKTANRLWSGWTKTVFKDFEDKVAEMTPIVEKFIAAMRKDGIIR